MLSLLLFPQCCPIWKVRQPQSWWKVNILQRYRCQPLLNIKKKKEVEKRCQQWQRFFNIGAFLCAVPFNCFASQGTVVPNAPARFPRTRKGEKRSGDPLTCRCQNEVSIPPPAAWPAWPPLISQLVQSFVRLSQSVWWCNRRGDAVSVCVCVGREVGGGLV